MPEETKVSNRQYLNFPPVERKIFSKNYLDLVLVELRFPTLLRLKKSEPQEIQEAIFNEFPLYQSSQTMQLTPLGTTEPEPAYVFSTRKQDYNVQLTASHLTLETRKYTSFEDFLEKLEYLVAACIPLLKTDFFTRVGLRYINKIGGMPNNKVRSVEWVKPSLLGPIAESAIGSVGSMKGEISGETESGTGYNFKYGLSPSNEEAEHTFILDYDYFRVDIEAGDVSAYLNEFHELHLPFFWWSLESKAKKALNDGTAKKG